MIRFLVDEDFNNDFVRGLLRRNPGTDLVRVQDLGLRGATDDVVLIRAASDGRVVLTHDVATLIACAYERVRAGQQMPGVIAVSQALPVGQVIEDLLLVSTRVERLPHFTSATPTGEAVKAAAPRLGLGGRW